MLLISDRSLSAKAIYIKLSYESFHRLFHLKYQVSCLCTRSPWSTRLLTDLVSKMGSLPASDILSPVRPSFPSTVSHPSRIITNPKACLNIAPPETHRRWLFRRNRPRYLSNPSSISVKLKKRARFKYASLASRWQPQGGSNFSSTAMHQHQYSTSSRHLAHKAVSIETEERYKPYTKGADDM